MGRVASLCAALIAVTAALVLAVGAAAGTGKTVSGKGERGDRSQGHRDFRHGKELRTWRDAQGRDRGPHGGNGHGHPQQQPPTGSSQAVGTVGLWPAVDDTQASDPETQGIYFKDYTLRFVGTHVEVWVANDLDFRPGDCRNGTRTQITSAQAKYIAGQFDGNVYPKESSVFSVPPPRDGTQTGAPNPPFDFHGQGDDVVILVDNIRDENWYDRNNANNFPNIAGFFDATITEFITDRNVITLDAFDWQHRTGANPPDNGVPGDTCSSPARPYYIESTLAHEYQHLLEYYEDPDEVDWVNEGLSQWAQTLTGYDNPALPITSPGFDGTIQCFLGWLGVATPANPNPRPDGGPENSLTIFGDQGFDEVLCDYGADYTFMEFLAGRYGTQFMTQLHRNDADGLVGLQQVLDQFGARTQAADVIHDWAAMVAVDASLDAGARLNGRGKGRDFQTPTLNASLNWDKPDAYSTPGAPPNGSDYVRFRNASSQYLTAGQLQSLQFDGAATLDPKPVEWTVDPSPPGHAGNPALFSGSADAADRAIVRQITVPAGSPTLSFQTRYDLEPGFDYGFVQVSTDGGATYTSLSNGDTNTPPDPTAIPAVQANQPGLNGDSGGWKLETFSLAPYAGQTIVLSFRLVTDFFGTSPGWWVDDVRVNSTLISDGTTLSGWQSPTQYRLTPVAGFTLQLVGIADRGGRPGDVYLATVPLDAGFNATLDRKALRKLLGDDAQLVGAIVTYDEPTESEDRYAPYSLVVNGVLQPGGGV